MDDTIQCPNCPSEDCYFNGISYECPNCDHTWGQVEVDDEEE